METRWAYCDELGPERIVQIYQPSTGLRAVVVIDNTARGPSIGGCRMAPDVSIKECFRLARAMTFKNAAAGLRHGGGKSVIYADPEMSAADKERLIRAFAVTIGELHDYIVGPDMGTNELCMGWCYDEIGRAVGLPRALGGIPLDEIGATGFGLAVCAEEAEAFIDLKLDGARVAIQGYGAVGRHAARFLCERGAVLVAVSDIAGAVRNPDGIDVDALDAHKAGAESVGTFPGGESIPRDSLIGVPCDIWIPAARPDVITAENADQLKANLVVCGANIPVTAEAEQMLAARDVLVVPDFIANAGGVICAAVEYHGGTESGAFREIEEKIRRNTVKVLGTAASRGCLPREAAVEVARQRVCDAMALRRFHTMRAEPLHASRKRRAVGIGV